MKENKFTLPPVLDGEDKTSPFINRIRKNYKHIRKWAKRTETNCFRIYDRDVPQYPYAIDYYDGRFCVHYYAKGHESEVAEEHQAEVEYALDLIFGAKPDHIYWRTRVKTKKTRQYEKADESEEFFTVYEFGIKFKVNLRDYLDTGLFLDHRETRKLVANMAKGKRILNLFAYTSSFSVHAAAGGALLTKSVDMSNTYIEWSRDNFILNSLSSEDNVLVRADCMKFLLDEIRTTVKYDLIIIDPPTISRSKKMDEMFDIQKDYVFLLKQSLRLLEKGGVIIFSTNSRRFNLDVEHFPASCIIEISHKTLPLDFHDPKIHRCWKIQHDPVFLG